MILFEKVKDWYLTKKTGLTAEERRIRAWYDERINYRGTYLKEIYHGFDYIIEVDPYLVLDFGHPLGWNCLPDFKKYQYPELPLEEAASWAWVRGFWEHDWHTGKKRYAHNEIAGGDSLFVITNSKEVAVEITVKYTGITAPNYEDEISKLLAAEIQREIDWEFLRDIFLSNGWHQITLQNNKPSKEWLKKNIKYPFHASPGLDQFVFQDKHEAAIFALRWS